MCSQSIILAPLLLSFSSLVSLLEYSIPLVDTPPLSVSHDLYKMHKVDNHDNHDNLLIEQQLR